MPSARGPAIPMLTTFSRRQFLAAATVSLAGRFASVRAQGPPATRATIDIGLINGKIHAMDAANRVVSQVLIRNGRFAAVGNNVVRREAGLRIVDLKGKTAI